MLAASAARSLLARAARPLASSVLPEASCTQIGVTTHGGATRSASAEPYFSRHSFRDYLDKSAKHLRRHHSTMVETVTFNVGGRRFEVSRALIDEHLGGFVLDPWNEDPGNEVFIDRDGDLFAHVLNYLRYGSIELPITVPRAMFDREIDYYGINSPDEGKIVSRDSLAKMMDSLQAPVDEAEKRLKPVQGRRDDFLLASECFRQYCERRQTLSDNAITLRFSGKDKAFHRATARFNHPAGFPRASLGGKDVEWLETCLGHFGLMLTAPINIMHREISVKMIE
ncbi:hypothetical protein ACHAXT_012470 [Thalassiosira profunda]